MKKLVMIALAFATLQATAQERRNEHRKGDRKERAHTLKNMSAEEIATLKTKKMVLHLDLNDTQQKEVYKLNLENAKDHKAKIEARKKMKENNEEKKTPSKEERYKMMNERLDKQIAQKRKLKSILTPEQYEKLEKGMKHRKVKQRKKTRNRAEKRRS